MSSKLFVGNLSYTTGEAELRSAFEAVGALRSVAIITDRMTGQPRGFGFVEYERPDDAQRAIASLDGQQVDGRTISVNVARERERTPRFGGGDRSEGGGGFGGGGGGFGGGREQRSGGRDGGRGRNGRGGGGSSRW